MRKRFGLGLLLGLAASAAMGQSMSTTDAKDAGASFGKSLGGSAITNNIKSADPQQVAPGFNGSPGETGLFQGGQGQIAGPGATKVAGCDGKSDIECQAVNLMRTGPLTRPQFTINRTDPDVSRARGLIANPSTQVGDMFSTYANCQESTTESPAEYKTVTCEDYATADPIQCVQARIVEVQATYNYQCDQSQKQLVDQKCERKLLVTCDPQGDGCDNGGIVTGSTQGDMAVWFGGVGGGSYALRFGTFGDNYWNDCTNVQQRSLTFNIADKDQLTQFSLAQVAWDDYILIKLNGTIVYSGPDGGNTLFTYLQAGGKFSFRRVCTNSDKPGLVGRADGAFPGTCYGSGSPERSTSWNNWPWIDLRPHIVTGTNVISFNVLACGGGEGVMQIYTRMKCPLVCHDNWDDQCAGLAAQSK